MSDGREIVTLPPRSYGAMKRTLTGPLGDLTPIDVAWEALQDEPEESN